MAYNILNMWALNWNVGPPDITTQSFAIFVFDGKSLTRFNTSLRGFTELRKVALADIIHVYRTGTDTET